MAAKTKTVKVKAKSAAIAVAEATPLTGKELDKAISALAISAKDMKNRIHFLAKCACLEVVRTKNTSVLDRLAKACEDVGSRALLSWLNDFAPADFNRETKKFDLDPKARDKAAADIEAYTSKIDATPYYKAKPDNVNTFNGFNTLAKLKSIVKQYSKLTDEQKEDERTDLTGMSDIQALIKKLEGAAPKKPCRISRSKVSEEVAEVTIN